MKPKLHIPDGWYSYNQMHDLTGRSVGSISSAASKGIGFTRWQHKDSKGRIIVTLVKKK